VRVIVTYKRGIFGQREGKRGRREGWYGINNYFTTNFVKRKRGEKISPTYAYARG
jgi:hypothetical protein